LDRACRGQGARGLAEHGKPAVSFTAGAHYAAVIFSHQLLDKSVVSDERQACLIGVLLPEPGAALNIREQERDRRLRGVGSFEALPSSPACSHL
jgi:hypothetical protein